MFGAELDVVDALCCEARGVGCGAGGVDDGVAEHRGQTVDSRRETVEKSKNKANDFPRRTRSWRSFATEFEVRCLILRECEEMGVGG